MIKYTMSFPDAAGHIRSVSVREDQRCFFEVHLGPAYDITISGPAAEVYVQLAQVLIYGGCVLNYDIL